MLTRFWRPLFQLLLHKCVLTHAGYSNGWENDGFLTVDDLAEVCITAAEVRGQWHKIPTQIHVGITRTFGQHRPRWIRFGFGVWIRWLPKCNRGIPCPMIHLRQIFMKRSAIFLPEIWAKLWLSALSHDVGESSKVLRSGSRDRWVWKFNHSSFLSTDNLTSLHWSFHEDPLNSFTRSCQLTTNAGY